MESGLDALYTHEQTAHQVDARIAHNLKLAPQGGADRKATGKCCQQRDDRAHDRAQTHQRAAQHAARCRSGQLGGDQRPQARDQRNQRQARQRDHRGQGGKAHQHLLQGIGQCAKRPHRSGDAAQQWRQRRDRLAQRDA